MLASLLALAAPPRIAAAQGAKRGLYGPRYLIQEGRAGFVLLADFAPNPLRAACLALNKHRDDAARRRFRGAKRDPAQERRYRDALKTLRAELAAHPDSLAAYLGLSQADPAFRRAERARLRGSAPKNAVGKFKLGVTLYLTWCEEPSETMMVDSKRLRPALALLEAAYNESGQTLIGMVFVDACLSIPDQTGKMLAVTARCLQNVVGPEAWKQYAQSKAKNAWRGPTPAVGLVPVSRRIMAYAVLFQRQQILVANPNARRQSGSPPWSLASVPPVKMAEALYLGRWYQSLFNSVGSNNWAIR
jgi:hypothetical protein